MEQSQNFLPMKAPSTQLGIFKGRGQIHEKGTLNLLIEYTVCEYCFSDPLVEEYCGRFIDIMILIADSYRGRGGQRGPEVKLPENLQNHTFSS